MATPRIQVSVDDAAFQHRLEGIAGRFDDATELWQSVEPVVYASFGDWMDSEGSGEWAPLSPRYAAWKAAHYPGRRILELTGALRASLNKGGAGNVRRLDKREAAWGTRVPYARFHDKGTSRMPRRRVLVLEGDFRSNFLAAAGHWLRETVRG